MCLSFGFMFGKKEGKSGETRKQCGLVNRRSCEWGGESGEKKMQRACVVFITVAIAVDSSNQEGMNLSFLVNFKLI